MRYKIWPLLNAVALDQPRYEFLAATTLSLKSFREAIAGFARNFLSAPFTS